MINKWTEEQKQVISLRHRNILVSAAAGSGKTAVLVERMIQLITDSSRPVDIDQLLVVTFTKAAAAEMRERVLLAIEARLEAEPDNLHLQRQAVLVHNAKITTIDSFCQYVIGNYFYKIDLEPGFRIGDEGEMKLLRSDVLDTILENRYEESTEEFCDFVEKYATDKKDENLKEEILRLYDFSMSNPWPMDWLVQCARDYEMTDPGKIDETQWMQTLIHYWKSEVDGMKQMCEQALKLCEMPGGPYMYEKALNSDLEQLTKLTDCNSYEAFSKGFSSIEFIRLGVKKKTDELEETLTESVKKLRNDMKTIWKKLNQDYFNEPIETVIMHIENAKPSAQMLIELVKEFMEAFEKEKRDRNLLDFDDLEHNALKILVDEKTRQPSAVAKEFQNFYEEIMIDEYQDSNYVQELLLTSISKESQGLYNIFMVGDVKQSIYGFRLARPDLFMEKYHTYTIEESDHQKIELHKNFRSFDCVLESVNDLCYPLLQENLGGITYDDTVALYPGGNFSEEDMTGKETELLLTEKDPEAEAQMIIEKIREMVNSKTGLTIYDKDQDIHRKARYSDIVILMRSLGQRADLFIEKLKDAGIPAYSQSRTGYFQALEVQSVLSLLQVVDNPRQDIPLAAVLSSPMVGLLSEQLAEIKAFSKEAHYFDAVRIFIEEGPEGETKNKLQKFYEQLEDYRKRSTYMQIHELLTYLLEDTGYEQMVAAMPAGQQRTANLNMLVERAIAYEKTSYRGLFQFVRYIHLLRKYEVDFGEAENIGENENAVGLFSIHKSKGLEFPIVIVAGLGKSFNMQDLTKKVVLHSRLGIGLDDFNLEKRTKCPTILKRAINIQNKMELLGEELRILYVAVTRAREKLILTAGVNKVKECEAKYENPMDTGETCTFHERFSATSMMNWILSAFSKYPGKYKLTDFDIEEMIEQQAVELMDGRWKKQELYEHAAAVQKQTIKNMNEKLRFAYAYKKDADIPAKVSVSELKMQSMKETDQGAYEMFEQPEKELYIPKFIAPKEETIRLGALRGTAFHRVLECMDFTQNLTIETIEAQMTQMEIEKRITAEMKQMVQLNALQQFFETPLFEKMQKADRAGKLYKEQPFVMSLPADEVNPSFESKEPVLIQGIIDVYFEEEDYLVLMDYKTDAVDTKEKLVEHYKKQLELYATALEKTTGKKVRECFLYSFHLKEQISIAI